MPIDYDRQAGMTGWYNLPQLMRTAVEVFASTTIGGMLDRREVMAALNPFDDADFRAHHDHSGEAAPFWFDYAADTGDGFRSTFAVARMLARPELAVGEHVLPRGKALILGGDLVYPTPSPDAYATKLEAPFRFANLLENPSGSGACEGDLLYAIPGNHDWYDGLNAFTKRFCARRPRAPGALGNDGHVVCGRQTLQTRSYFAARLPQNWWIFGVDSQLADWIDDEQLAYFNYISQSVMEDGANVILCTPTPQWAYVDETNPRVALRSLSYAAAAISGQLNDPRLARDETARSLRFPTLDNSRRHNIRLYLAGDMHHYVRFVEQYGDGPPVHYVTCGLGGAFMHPTHMMYRRARFAWPYRPASPLSQPPAAQQPSETGGKQFQREFRRVGASFPTAPASRRMAWRNLAFAWLNPWFSVAMAGVALFSAWTIVAAARQAGVGLVETLGRAAYGEALTSLLVYGVFASPWPSLVMFGICFGLTVFARVGTYPVQGRAAHALLRRPRSARRRRLLIGVSHGLVHILLFTSALILASRLTYNAFGLRGPWGEFALVSAMTLYGLIVPPTTMGLYLLATTLLFGMHRTEAYSSLRIEDYKGFLRLRIDGRGDLSIFPICCEKLPAALDGPLRLRLIEEPIVLPARAAEASPEAH